MIEVILAAVLSVGATEQADSPSGEATAPNSSCSVDKEAMLRLSPSDFDQGPHGWRALAAKPDCHLATADLIAEYRHKHWRTSELFELHISYWHEGQMRASADQRELAVKLLLAGVSPQSIGFSDYALATVAFLQNDLEALRTARARLAAAPKPAEFTGKWPPNLDVVDGLLACFGKPYLEAYSASCRPG